MTTAKQPDLLTVSTGVVFRLKQPSTWALTNVQQQLMREEPKVPMVFIESKGREEPNEADPAYIAALRRHASRISERLYEVVIATGTEVDSVPDGFPTFDQDSWRDTLLGVGVELSDDPRRRYVEWVKYWAATGELDWLQLYTPLLRKVGTSEADVAEATEAFRGVPERGADNQPGAEGSDSDRD